MYLKILIRVFCVNKGDWDQSTPSNSPRVPGTKIKIGKEKVHHEGSSKSVRLMSVVLARQKFGERSREETLHQERCARKAAWDLATNIYELKNLDKTTFYTPIGKRDVGTNHSTRPEEREFVVDSGA